MKNYKKIFLIFIPVFFITFFSACGCKHEWYNATCTSPQICMKCGTTKGEALGHDFADSTCTEPQICRRCGKIQGKALGHDIDEATCTNPRRCKICGKTFGNALDHDYIDATCTTPKICNRCGKTFGDALGHDYIYGCCSRCNQEDPDATSFGLNSLFVIDSYNYQYKIGSFTDSYGNSYDGVHLFNDLYQSGNGREPHSEFNLNQKYKTFSGSIVATTQTSVSTTYYVHIYVDGDLKFSKTGFSKTSEKIDFNIDVTNGKKLKITMGIDGNMGDFNQDLGIVNAVLTKK